MVFAFAPVIDDESMCGCVHKSLHPNYDGAMFTNNLSDQTVRPGDGLQRQLFVELQLHLDLIEKSDSRRQSEIAIHDVCCLHLFGALCGCCITRFRSFATTLLSDPYELFGSY